MAKYFETGEEVKREDDSLEALEEESKQELDELAQGFRERMAAESKRFVDVCDSEYYCCVCFTTRDQKEEFLNSLGISPDERYIDGREIAKKIGRAIKSPDMAERNTRPFDKDFVRLSRK